MVAVEVVMEGLGWKAVMVVTVMVWSDGGGVIVVGRMRVEMMRVVVMMTGWR